MRSLCDMRVRGRGVAGVRFGELAGAREARCAGAAAGCLVVALWLVRWVGGFGWMVGVGWDGVLGDRLCRGSIGRWSRCCDASEAEQVESMHRGCRSVEEQ